MQELTPKAVPNAVRIAISVWIQNFKVSFLIFIVFFFELVVLFSFARAKEKEPKRKLADCTFFSQEWRLRLSIVQASLTLPSACTSFPLKITHVLFYEHRLRLSNSSKLDCIRLARYFLSGENSQALLAQTGSPLLTENAPDFLNAPKVRSDLNAFIPHGK